MIGTLEIADTMDNARVFDYDPGDNSVYGNVVVVNINHNETIWLRASQVIELRSWLGEWLEEQKLKENVSNEV